MGGWSLLNPFKRSGIMRHRVGVPNTLSGYFELRVDRIVGWVSDAYGSTVASMQIDIFGPAGIIASFGATARPEHRRFVFSFPVEDRFTGAQLIKEEVFIVARDSDGNNGRVLLDGAAQLELIRDHLGVPAKVILDLDFRLGGNAKPYLGDGWSGEEPDHTWAENDESVISFDTPAQSGTYALRITAAALIHKPDLPGQDLTVFINAAQIAYLHYNEPHIKFNECRFSHEAFADAPRSTLRLHHPDAVRPCDIDLNSDRRKLAFRFRRLTLARLLPLQVGPLVS